MSRPAEASESSDRPAGCIHNGVAGIRLLGRVVDVGGHERGSEPSGGSGDPAVLGAVAPRYKGLIAGEGEFGV